jgi:oligosaccharide repeat unit polymerase
MKSFEPAARRHALPAWVWLVLPGTVLLLLVAITTLHNLPLIAPLTVQLAACGALVASLWRRRGGWLPWFEIGAVYSTIVLLYGVYPLVKFLVLGEHYFAPQNDSRWSVLRPSPDEVAAVAWFYAAHLVGFALAYLTARGRLPLTVPEVRPPSTPVIMAALAGYLLIQGFWMFLGLFYDTSSSSYVASYLVVQRLPLVLAQLLNHLNGAKYPLELVILVGLFAKHSTRKPLIVGWIAFVAILTFVRLGSRTELALLVMSAGMMYHMLVRPIRPAIIASGVVAGVVAFALLGMARGGWSYGGGLGMNPLLYPSEFDVLFGNAVELYRASVHGSLNDVPTVLYFADFAALLPQQVAPFQKVDPAMWYVTTFYPEYASWGGGLAFGTMAEAALTGGWPSAAVRGVVLGLCFAGVHRLYTRHSNNYWAVVFYVWMTTLSYQSFRATTLYFLVLFVFRFLPVVLAVKIAAAVLNRAARRTEMWLNLKLAREHY